MIPGEKVLSNGDPGKHCTVMYCLGSIDDDVVGGGGGLLLV